jgi:eukaryotic-like serine/threonine-protein kinase
VNPELAGDLETIIAKALERDPERRYQSTAELGADLRRLMLDQPIAARPASVAYRSRKFIARHRVLVTAGSIAVLSLVIGLVLAGIGLVRAMQERNLALAAERDALAKRATAEAVTGLLQRMLSSANPHEVKGADYTVRQLLDDFSTKLGRDLEDQPEVEASVRATVGNAYRLLGVYGPAREHLSRALELRAAAMGRTDRQTIQSEMDFAWLLHDEADYAGAATRFRAVGARLAGEGKSESVEWATSTAGLSDVLSHIGDLEEAERWGREAVRVRKALLGPRHADTGASVLNLSKVVYQRGAFADAAALGTEALEILKAVHGDEHPVIVDALNHMAWLRYMDQDFAGCEADARRVLAMGERVLGSSHPDVGNSLYAIGMALNGLGRNDEADEVLQRALAIYRQAHGEVHPAVATTLAAISTTLRARKRYEEAEQTARQSLDIRRKVHGDLHFEVAVGLTTLGRAQSLRGDHDGAMQSLAKSIEVYTALVGPDHPFVIVSLRYMAADLQRQGRLEEAGTKFEEALALSRKVRGADHVETLDRIADLAKLRAYQGRHGDAESLLSDAIAAAEKAGGRAARREPALMLARARSLLALDRADEALAVLEDSHARADSIGDAGSADARAAAKEIAAVLEKRGDAVAAARWRERAQLR